MKQQYKTQMDRVIHMEQIYDLIQTVMDSEEEIRPQLEQIMESIEELQSYYEGPEWMEDYDADSLGVFPKDLKRAVLSQDTLYELFYEIDQVMNEVSDIDESY